MSRAVRNVISTCAILGLAATPAEAQYSQSLFLEAARDPGRADAPKTARELAMGAVQAISGAADEALASPGTLTRGSGTDFVFSLGRSAYARRELVHTPRQLPPFDAARRLSATSTEPIGYAAAATRRSHLALAGFFDANSRYSHRFRTESAVLYTAALFPTLITESAAGEGGVEQSVTRIGGSVAFGNRQAGIGASVFLVHLAYSVDARTPIEIGSRTIADPVFRVRCCVDDTDRVAFDDWSAGLGVSGHFSPAPHLTFTARWRREPTFDATRRGSREEARAVQPVQFKLPDVVGFGVVAPFGRTTIAGEVARHLYEGVFSPLGTPASDPNYACAQFRVAHADACAGWNFPYHDTRDTTVLKAAVEHGVPIGFARVLLRGGVAREPAYTLARAASHPSTRRGLDFPEPPVVTPWEPPRDDLTWLSGGVAVAWSGAEVGFGLARASHQARFLVDVRIQR